MDTLRPASVNSAPGRGGPENTLAALFLQNSERPGIDTE
jgi:hypothetical protein